MAERTRIPRTTVVLEHRPNPIGIPGIQYIGTQIECWDRREVHVTYGVLEGCREAWAFDNYPIDDPHRFRLRPYCIDCDSNGWRRVEFDDEPVGGRPGRFVVFIRRRECGSVLRADLPPALRYAPLGITPRGLICAAKLVCLLTDAEAARQTGLDRRKIRVIAAAVGSVFAAPHVGEGQIALALDGVHPHHATYMSVTEPARRRVIDLVAGSPDTVFPAWQRTFLPLDRIDAVVMDRAGALRTTVSAMALAAKVDLPVVADMPHLIRKAFAPVGKMYDRLSHRIRWVGSDFNAAERANFKKHLRKDWLRIKETRTKKLLDFVLEQIPQLQESYIAYVLFCRTFTIENPDRAMWAFDLWRDAIPTGQIDGFYQTMLDVTQNWRQEVRNYFAVRVNRRRLTAGFPESSHRGLKQRKRDARGRITPATLRTWYLRRWGLEREARLAFALRHLPGLMRCVLETLEHHHAKDREDDAA